LSSESQNQKGNGYTMKEKVVINQLIIIMQQGRYTL